MKISYVAFIAIAAIILGDLFGGKVFQYVAAAAGTAIIILCGVHHYTNKKEGSL